MKEFALNAVKLRGLVSVPLHKPVNKFVVMVLEIHSNQLMNAMMGTLFLVTAVHKNAKSKNNFNAYRIR